MHLMTRGSCGHMRFYFVVQLKYIYRLYAIYCDMIHELAPVNKLHVCTLFLYVPTRDFGFAARDRPLA